METQTPADAAPRAVPRPLDRRLAIAWDAVGRPDVKVFSTDVFDTLVWRQVAEPIDAFPLVGARLRAHEALDPDVSPAAFGRLRALAERHARALLEQATGRVEVSLEEIYLALPDWIFGRAGGSAAAVAVELAVEAELLLPDLDVAALLRAAEAAGQRVVAVSDIYYSGAQLRGLLDQPPLDQIGFERIFTSSEHRTNKSGGLFEIALEELGVAPEAVLHLGDNPVADEEVPGRLGIATIAFERRPPALERLLTAEARQLPAATLASGGRERGAREVAIEVTALRGKVAARTERNAYPRALRPFWDYGAVVLGPVLTGWAEWTAEEAARLGADRVHCFMREGAFLSGLIERAALARGLAVSAEPLWLNREVLARATIASASPDELAPLLARRSRPTVARFLAGIGLSPSDLPRFASHADTSLHDPTTRAGLIEAIGADDAARAKVLAAARAARERVVTYLEGLLAGGQHRIVCADLGWGASAQGLLVTVLHEAGIALDVSGLYLVAHEGAGSRVVGGGLRVQGFLGEHGAPEAFVGPVVRSPEVLEQVCLPDHGSQMALTEHGAPVLGPGLRAPLQSLEAETVRRGVEAFQREWARYHADAPGKLGRLSQARDRLRAILLRSVVAPTAEEAAAFASWMHDENQGSERTEAIADPALLAHLRHLDPGGLQDLPMERAYWPVALAAQVDPTWAESIAAASAGQVSWEALSGDTDTGHFEIGVARGVQVPPTARIRTVPRRNRFGLSYVAGTLEAPALQELVVRPAEAPCVLRLDFLELRCFAQGLAEPVELRFEAPADFARLARANCFALNPNVFVSHGSTPSLHLDLTAAIAPTVFRVEVACGFALLAIGQVLPTPGRLRGVEDAGVLVDRLEGVVADMQGSLSWKVTKPLRVAKRLAGGR